LLDDGAIILKQKIYKYAFRANQGGE